MRVATWNCNGAFRGKLQHADTLNADILIIQECEDPARSMADYRSWAGNYAWAGTTKNKGIGVFPRKGQTIETLPWSGEGFELFLPVQVGGVMDLLGVWTQRAKSSKFGYTGQLWHYLQSNKSWLGIDTVIAGDFNSNQIWDKPGRAWNHSECVRELESLGFRSLYHAAVAEAQGQERQPTFYHHRDPHKTYHIDYMFAHAERLNHANLAISVGEPARWLSLSDHMPIVANF